MPASVVRLMRPRNVPTEPPMLAKSFQRPGSPGNHCTMRSPIKCPASAAAPQTGHVGGNGSAVAGSAMFTPKLDFPKPRPTHDAAMPSVTSTANNSSTASLATKPTRYSSIGSGP
jgi:hypothetical protein